MTEMPEPAGSSIFNRFIILATLCLVVAVLYVAQNVLVPIALAVLFTFLLTPLVIRLERVGVPRSIAAAGCVLLGLCLLGVLAWMLSSQAVDLANQWPNYKENISNKFSNLPFLHGDGAVHKLVTASHDLQNEMSSASGNATTKPIPVTVTDQSTMGMSQIRSLLGAIESPIATILIAAVFIVFMLLQREDLRDRIIRLVGEGQLDITTQALSDAGNRISRFLLMNTLVNAGYGIAIGVGLWTIGRVSGHPGGFPDWVLWGLIVGLCRFVPYIGPWIGAFFPIVLSIAVFPGFKEFVATAGLFVCVETLTGSGVEPLLYGSTTGLSALAVLAAAVFWGWLWGPIGLLLSTPLTVCVAVIGKHVPQMEFLDVLLGDEPPLPPATRLYQRLLALDSEAVSDVIDEYRRNMSLEKLYDAVIVPAMAMAEKNHHTDRLDESRRASIRQILRDSIDELGEAERTLAVNSQAKAVEQSARSDTPPPPPTSPARPRLPGECTVTVLCLPAHDESDELVATMASQLLELRGYCTIKMGQSALASEMLEGAEQKAPDIILVSALPPTAITHARYLCKLIHNKLPAVSSVVGLWTYNGDLTRAGQRIATSDKVHVVPSLKDALEQINQIAQKSILKNAHEKQNDAAPALSAV